MSGLIALPIEQKRSLKKMGEKSEAFCRQALRVLEQNPQMVPSNVALADAMADLAALDALRPRMVRLSRLSERVADTAHAPWVCVDERVLRDRCPGGGSR